MAKVLAQFTMAPRIVPPPSTTSFRAEAPCFVPQALSSQGEVWQVQELEAQAVAEAQFQAESVAQALLSEEGWATGPLGSQDAFAFRPDAPAFVPQACFADPIDILVRQRVRGGAQGSTNFDNSFSAAAPAVSLFKKTTWASADLVPDALKELWLPSLGATPGSPLMSAAHMAKLHNIASPSRGPFGSLEPCTPQTPSHIKGALDPLQDLCTPSTAAPDSPAMFPCPYPVAAGHQDLSLELPYSSHAFIQERAQMLKIRSSLGFVTRPVDLMVKAGPYVLETKVQADVCSKTPKAGAAEHSVASTMLLKIAKGEVQPAVAHKAIKAAEQGSEILNMVKTGGTSSPSETNFERLLRSAGNGQQSLANESPNGSRKDAASSWNTSSWDWKDPERWPETKWQGSWGSNAHHDHAWRRT